MKFWFTPAWRSDDKEKRAKALDRMSDGKLLAIIRDPAKGDYRMAQIRREAVQRLSAAALLRVALDTSVQQGAREEAICRIDDEQAILTMLQDLKTDSENLAWALRQAAKKLPAAALGKVALDPSIRGFIRHEAIERVDDEAVLLAYVRDETAFLPGAALGRMRTGKLILQEALRDGRSFFRAAAYRLETLGDGESLRTLALKAVNVGEMDATTRCLEALEGDTAFVERLAREAASVHVRAQALQTLRKKGLVTEEMRAEARALARQEIRTKTPDPKLVWPLLEIAGPGEALSSEEQGFFYDQLRETPVRAKYLDWLLRAGDPAGAAFMPFCQVLYEDEAYGKHKLTEEELERVLAVEENFALDYLLSFIRRAEQITNSRLGGPETMIEQSAAAICRMHRAGRAKARIERELPQTKTFSVHYVYQDSDNDLRNERDVITVRFWA